MTASMEDCKSRKITSKFKTILSVVRKINTKSGFRPSKSRTLLGKD